MRQSENLFGEHIRQVRQSRGLTQKAFAESLGIAQGFLSSIERGRKVPSTTLLIALRHLYQIDECWIPSGDEAEKGGGEMTAPVAELPSTPTTPLLKRIPPGFPQAIGRDDILQRVSLPDANPDSLALVAYGDFMAPTIQDGDLVLFRTGNHARHGDIALVKNLWGDVILRRYRVTDEGIWLSPDNSLYRPFRGGEHAPVIGVVVDVWRKVRF